MLKKAITISFAVGLIIASESYTFAGPIIGGSTLLSENDQHQLESWLGEGNLTLTNIFSKKLNDGKTSHDFHVAADGKGRTFTVIEVVQDQSHSRQIIGGYDPQSWNSTTVVNYTPNYSDRTAFLFNLTSSVKQDQRRDGSFGFLQTVNYDPYGPTFGEGHDLYSDTNLEYGYNYSSGYGPKSAVGYNTLLENSSGYYFNIGSIEIFSIANDSATTAAPEPACMSLLTFGALSTLVHRMRKPKLKAKLAA